ncbi:MAG: calcium-translocating P-type ATPase, SERCA-type [Candidatus Omnitrophota bacterium]|jgi:Ca2+-transporting ATPase
MMKNWWELDTNEVEKALGVDASIGLSPEEVESRLKKYGLNQLKEKKAINPLEILIDQFKDFIVWVLVGAALVSGFLKEWVDALAIVAIVIVNAILGFIQEYRAEKSLAALKKLSSPNSRVIRGGIRQIVSSHNIVPGDIVELEAGDNIPADSRLIWITPNFTVSEASLTGESHPVAKTTLFLKEREVPLADRANMVYMGTSIASGKARAIVVDTGMETELGNIAGMLQTADENVTPLQRRLEAFGKFIVYICFGLVGLVFVMELLRGSKLIDVFLTSVSLAVAAIPEGLPAVVTIALALGVQRMVKRHVIIRKLPSVETLGCATVICSDKTGTLTKNEMTVQAVYVNNMLFNVTGIGYDIVGEFTRDYKAIDLTDYPELNRILSYATLCNGAELVREKSGYKVIGDPTEGSILTAAAKMHIWKKDLEERFPFIEEIPFDSERKKMTIVRRGNGMVIAFSKGAPDIFLDDCVQVEDRTGPRKLEEKDKKAILAMNEKLASQAMRVLAIGYRNMDSVPESYNAEAIEKDLVFLGLVAMIDPAREEVKGAIRKCDTAGIKTVMITGDHKNTAIAIAKELGFFRSDSVALTGAELDKLSDDELYARIENIPVYARVSPEHKLRIVKAWRRQGDVVAMTGDGVNDAPAVKEADIGVSMGITGTDVTKEVSDMVITDDNFASIVSAVEEGRGIYDNIKKFIHYLLSCNVGEILVMFVSSLVGFPAPLLPIQILWVNLVTDGLPALALGVDPVDKQIMDRPPRKQNEPVVTKANIFLMFWQGSFIALCSLLAFSFVLFVEKEGIGRARTAAFIVLACSQLFHSFNCRSNNVSIFKLGFLTNKKLILAVLVSFSLQMLVVYQPFLQTVFKTEALGAFDWFLVVIISSFPLWAMEIVKRLTHRQ